MTSENILHRISQGRTDLVVELMKDPQWKAHLNAGPVKLIQWLVYYNDTTAIRLVLANGGTLDSINLDEELGNAAFFGHWKVCDFLLGQGANVNSSTPESGETPLHSALSKAGRPYYFYTVRLLVENGADINARTIPGMETGAFMRDVRTRGETPLHRAAAYADLRTINFLIEHGADREIRDAHGDTPLSWASYHLRPGSILAALSFGKHTIGEAHKSRNTSDHGNGWGNGMDWNLFGEYLPDDQ